MQPLTRARRAARKAALATQERNDAIRAAHEAGESLRRIGEAVGLSHVRVLKIIRGE